MYWQIYEGKQTNAVRNVQLNFITISFEHQLIKTLDFTLVYHYQSFQGHPQRWNETNRKISNTEQPRIVKRECTKCPPSLKALPKTLQSFWQVINFIVDNNKINFTNHLPHWSWIYNKCQLYVAVSFCFAGSSWKSPYPPQTQHIQVLYKTEKKGKN